MHFPTLALALSLAGSPQAAPDAESVRLIAWLTAYQANVRQVFGSSVNGLSAGAAPACIRPDEASVRADLAKRSPHDNSCLLCQSRPAAEPGQASSLDLTAEQLARSVFALCNQAPAAADLPPPGGLTLRQLYDRACRDCSGASKQHPTRAAPPHG